MDGNTSKQAPKKKTHQNVNEKTINSSSQIQLLGFSSSSASSSAS